MGGVAAMWKWLVVLGAGIAASSHVSASWQEASSDHFVVYADQKESEVRAFTDRLERFHNAMAGQLNVENTKPSPSNRVTIYFVRNEKEVQKISGSKNRFLGGFYIPRAGGSVAFVPEVDDVSARASGYELTLLHEYAHHFMYSNSSTAYPRWLSEGFAEFFASAKFEKNGDVGIGLPAQHRSYELQTAKRVPIEQILDTAEYEAKKSKQYDAFYGQSWALFHYLHFEPTRNGQMRNYLGAIKNGQSEIEAARSAFGDLKKLEKELDRYLMKRLMSYRKLSGDGLKPGPITIRPLSMGEAAIMPVLMQSKRGVDDEGAAELLPLARKIAAQFPADAAVMAALSEAEFDAGNNKEAIAAADKAVAIDSKRVNAIIQKGYAMARLAADAEDEKVAWKNVRKQFVAVNKIEVDHPIPLIEYYKSYKNEGENPTKIAVDGLEWALAMSPFDQGLRWMTANQQMEDKRFAEAVLTLGPLAANPHDPSNSAEAQKLLDHAKEKLALQKAAAN